MREKRTSVGECLCGARGSVLWLLVLATSLTVQAQNDTMTTEALSEASPASTNVTTTDNGMEDQELLPAIIGGAVGGGVLLLLLGALCICCCCCCCCRRRRHKDMDLEHSEGAQVSTTFNRQDPNGYRPVNEDAMFEMQMNMADSMMATDVIASHHETNMPVNTDPSMSVRNPHAVLVPQDSYVEMGSFVGLKGSKSADNIIDMREDPGSVEAYCSTDTIIVSAGIASISTGKHIKPLPAPKPKHLQPDHCLLKSEDHQATQGDEGDEGEDMYVETQVFVQDRQQQDDDDSYYNADTIQTIREGRALIEVVDPVQTHTVYGNIDPPPTPEHRGKKDVPQEPEENYLTVEDFLGSGGAPKSSPSYYNYNPLEPLSPPAKQPAATEEETDNYVEVVKPNVEDPYTLEDNQYIFMQSRMEAAPISSSRAVDEFLEAGDSPGEDTSDQSKRYQNFNPGMDKRRYMNINDLATTPQPPREEILAQLHFPPKEGGPSSAYAEDKPEELYEELT